MANLWKAAAALLAAASVGVAAQAKNGDRIATGDLEWKQMFPGVNFAPAYGDWETGAHGKYVRIDHRANVPMHIHSGDYYAVVISGRLANLYEGGERIELSPGDYFYMAEKRPHAHECLTAEGCVFYTHADALWDIEVVGAR